MRNATLTIFPARMQELDSNANGKISLEELSDLAEDEANADDEDRLLQADVPLTDSLDEELEALHQERQRNGHLSLALA